VAVVDAGTAGDDGSLSSPSSLSSLSSPSPAAPETPVANEPAPPAAVPAAVPPGVDPTLPHAVVVVLNLASLRRHPVLSRLAPVLEAIPQIRDFNGSSLAVVRDLDWVVAYGPSFIHTKRVIGLVRYNVADKVIDDAVATTTSRVADHEHGPWDAGVPGVRASIGFNDAAPRVFARPQPKLLLITAPEDAARAISFFKKSPPTTPPPNEAIRVTLRAPHRLVALPGLPISDKLEQLRFWIVPTPSGGAEVNLEGDASTEAAAKEVADSWNDAIARSNSTIARVMTRGLVDKIRFGSEKKKVSMHLESSPEQTDAIVHLVAAVMGVPPASKAGPP
jgi:hypothetical protein